MYRCQWNSVSQRRSVTCQLPYGITLCYPPPDTSKHTPPQFQPDRPVLDLPTPDG